MIQKKIRKKINSISSKCVSNRLKRIEKISESKNIPLIVGNISDFSSSAKKTEEVWRRARYNFFKKFNDKPIITGHHLDDAIESVVSWYNQLTTCILNIPSSRLNYLLRSSNS